MRKSNYITSQNSEYWKRGQRLFLYLAPQTRQDIRLDTLKITYNYDEIRRLRKKKNGSPSYAELKKINKNTVKTLQEWREKAYYLMICIASLKTPLPYKDDNYDLYHGVSVTDILGARYGGYAFLHVDLNKEMILQSFKLLEKEKVVKEIIVDNGEVRYDIIEPSLKDFVKDCLDLFNGAIMFRFYITWKGIRPPSPEERQYCELHWGKKITDQRFIHVSQILRANKQNKTHNIKESKYRIECFDNSIYENIENLRGKYKDLIKKYPSLCERLIEIIYPKFLQGEVEKSHKKMVKKNGKWVRKFYPKLQMVFSKDTLEYSDSTAIHQVSV